MTKYKIMIVDDSFIIRTIIESANNTEKYELVAMACDGHQAIEQYLKHQPHIITMDLTMPHMDGIECIENLMLLNPDLQILVVSALNDEATGIKALKKGAAGFVTKPFTDEQICEAIDIIAGYIHIGK
jgi:two-component system chemotaxis response regulator CheY